MQALQAETRQRQRRTSLINSEPASLFSMRRKTGHKKECVGDGNRAMLSGNGSSRSCGRNDGSMVAVVPGRTHELS